jgi:two-component sensor histidine kinase
MTSAIPMTLADAAPSARQVGFAACVALLLLAYNALTWPFAARPGPATPGLLTVYQSTVILSDLLTAVLLATQVRHYSRLPLLALAAGYLFTAMVASLHLLSFPGVVTDTGLMGGLQTPNHLWLFWHGGFPVFVLACLVLEGWVGRTAPGKTGAEAGVPAARLLGLTGLGVMALVAGLTALVTVGAPALPDLMSGTDFRRNNETGIGPAILLLCMVTTLALALDCRRSVVRLWLTITMLAFSLDVLATLHAGTRFSVGWYAARGNSLVASILVLLVYLIENSVLVNAHQHALRHLAEANSRLRAAVEQKELLFREGHHRIKNNLQLVQSLLFLQSTRVDGVSRVVLEDTIGRIQAVGSIHDLLYRNTHTEGLDARLYVERLCEALGRSVAGILIHTDVANLRLDPDRAVTLGLVVSEAVLNALKHAFPQGHPGEVFVALQRGPDDIVLSVRDTGAGLPDSFDPARSSGLGARLIAGLASQLQARVEYSRHADGGSIFRMTMPEDALLGQPAGSLSPAPQPA